MHGHPPNYQALWIPDDVDPDEAIILGLKWLLEQDGEPLILLNAKIALRNNGHLEAAVHHYGIRHEAPVTIHNARWSGGAILAPWARDDVLRCIDDWLAFKTTAVCVIGWIPGSHDGWISARGAVNLVNGQPLGTPVSEIISDPVVRIAIDHAEVAVNHNNMLVQAEDKSYFVLTLQELARGGHRFDLDEVCTYMMATGWSGGEVKRAREYGERVLAGRRFNLRTTYGPMPGSCKHWEDEARGQAA